MQVLKKRKKSHIHDMSVSLATNFSVLCLFMSESLCATRKQVLQNKSSHVRHRIVASSLHMKHQGNSSSIAELESPL